MLGRRLRMKEHSFGVKLSLGISEVVGSWRFIIVLSIFMFSWVFWNIFSPVFRFDPPPFILLNLLLSFLAAYTGPILLMASNVQSEQYKKHLDADIDSLDKDLDILIANEKKMRKLIEKAIEEINQLE